jgi:hypothetical protein
MKTSELIVKIANLLLESDEETADWIHETDLRRCFYASWIFLILWMLNSFVIPTALGDRLRASVVATEVFRWSMFVIIVAYIASIMVMAFYYFRYVLSKRGGIYLRNILYFYILTVLFFGLLYFYTFTLFPNSFSFAGVTVPTTYGQIPTSVVRHFLLFSAFQSVNGTYFRIRPSSWLPSIITYVQSLFTISLISLLVASYVNQKTKASSA